MDESATLLFLVLSLSFSFVQSSERCSNRWVIELKDGHSSRTAYDLAIKYGLVNHGPVSSEVESKVLLERSLSCV